MTNPETTTPELPARADLVRGLAVFFSMLRVESLDIIKKRTPANMVLHKADLAAEAVLVAATLHSNIYPISGVRRGARFAEMDAEREALRDVALIVREAVEKAGGGR